MATTPKYQTSPSGYYKVDLKSAFEDHGFIYKPSMDDITVNEEILLAMIEAGVVAKVHPAGE